VSSLNNPPSDFWRGRRVLNDRTHRIQGRVAEFVAPAAGRDVTGYALSPASTPNCGISWAGDTASVIAECPRSGGGARGGASCRPQIVFHLAAQSLCASSYRDPLGTYSTNVLGTAAVLQACRELKDLECVLVITSDKVYENSDAGRPFEETDRLGGHDPYSNSKACAELLTASFRDSFFGDGPPVATARAGNVIGGGDWSPDRLIPDCVPALAAGKPVSLRYPQAVRPWQHVLEPLSGYLALAQALARAPDLAPRAVNFGPDAASFCMVKDVVDAFSARFAASRVGNAIRPLMRPRRVRSPSHRRSLNARWGGARASASSNRSPGPRIGIERTR